MQLEQSGKKIIISSIMGPELYLFRSILSSPKTDFCGKHFRRKRKKNTFKTMGAFFYIYVLKCLFTITTEKETFLSANIYNAWQA